MIREEYVHALDSVRPLGSRGASGPICQVPNGKCSCTSTSRNAPLKQGNGPTDQTDDVLVSGKSGYAYEVWSMIMML